LNNRSTTRPQSHHDFRGHDSPDIAASEAMALNSCLKLGKDRKERLAKRQAAEFPR